MMHDIEKDLDLMVDDIVEVSTETESLKKEWAATLRNG